jgi:hypothetical protein
MTNDSAFRGLLSALPTYLQRDGVLVCTTCGAVIGGNGGDQVRHTAWHTMLAAALVPPSAKGSTDAPSSDH